MIKIEHVKTISFVVVALATVFTSPAVGLLAGIVFAIVFGNPLPKMSKKISKNLLQISVVGLGFGMNIHEALQSGKDGMLFTIVSVSLVMILGWFLGKWVKLPKTSTYLISAGTAICGGSAIAAVAPITKSNDSEISISIATIFILNALALLIFPPIGKILGLSDTQFGTWAAIAIHDTSSVVGAGEIRRSYQSCSADGNYRETHASSVDNSAYFRYYVYIQRQKFEDKTTLVHLVFCIGYAGQYLSVDTCRDIENSGIRCQKIAYGDAIFYRLLLVDRCSEDSRYQAYTIGCIALDFYRAYVAFCNHIESRAFGYTQFVQYVRV